MTCKNCRVCQCEKRVQLGTLAPGRHFRWWGDVMLLTDRVDGLELLAVCIETGECEWISPDVLVIPCIVHTRIEE